MRLARSRRRSRQALRLRLDGHTYQAIADRLGYASWSSARSSVRAACAGDQQLLAAIAAVRAGTHRANGRYRYRGYILVRHPEHPLAQRRGMVFEHRLVLYDAVGPGPHPCARCDQSLDWPEITVHHVNAVRDDNRLENLQVVCRGCNMALYWESTRAYPTDDEWLLRAWLNDDPGVELVDGELVRLHEQTLEEAPAS